MSGLALGSLIWGRLADRSKNLLTVYVWLEFGIALSGLCVPWLIKSYLPFYQWLFNTLHFSFWGLTAVRFVLSTLTLIIPTTLMGGTLPVLTRVLVRDLKNFSQVASRLYAVNTLGAVAGCLATGFFFIYFFGLYGALGIAVALNLFLAIVVLFLNKSLSPQTFSLDFGDRPLPQFSNEIRPSLLLGLFVGYTLSGFTALGYEVVWSRLFVFIFTSDTYAFTIMLSSFLTGLAFGSFAFSAVVKKIKSVSSLFALLQGAIGLLIILSIPLLADLPSIQDWLFQKIGLSHWLQKITIKFILAFLLMFLPTFLMGATFPLINSLYRGQLQNLGQWIGTIYSLGTIGSVLGSLGSGFLMIPLLGTKNTLLLLAFINLLIMALLNLLNPDLRKSEKNLTLIGVAALILGSFLLTPKNIFNKLLNSSLKESQLIYYHEGLTGTVTIHQYLEYKAIFINGINVAGTEYELRTTQKCQAHLPLMLHPSPLDVLQIGFGSGETCHVLTTYPLRSIDVAEISADVLQTASQQFQEINHQVLSHPKINVFIMDGKNYALLSRKKYDVIMNDAIYPGLGGGSALYTTDHFLACRKRLNAGGILSSWLPIDIQKETFLMILKSFSSVFPHSTTVWLMNNGRNKHALLVGINGDFKIDVSRINDVLQDSLIQRDLAEVKLASLYEILDGFLWDPSAVVNRVKQSLPNTDKKPRVEFFEPRNALSMEALWSSVLQDIKGTRSSVLPYLIKTEPLLLPALAETLSRFSHATDHLWQGVWLDLSGESGARFAFESALNINPNDVGARFLLQDLDRRQKAIAHNLKKFPDSPVYLKLSALNLYQEARFTEALTLYQKLIAIGENSEAHYLQLIRCQLRLKKTKEAIGTAQFLSQRFPLCAEAYYYLAHGNNQLGEYQESINYCRQAIQRFPAISVNFYELAFSQFQLNLLKDAVANLEQAIARDSTQAPYYSLLGNTYFKMGQFQKSVDLLEVSLKSDSTDFQTYYNLGNAYMQLKKLPEAEQYYLAGLKYAAPQFYFLHHNLGILYFQQKKYALALTHIEEAYRLSQHNEQIGKALTHLRKSMSAP